MHVAVVRDGDYAGVSDEAGAAVQHSQRGEVCHCL
jgi:hypothetical protein